MRPDAIRKLLGEQPFFPFRVHVSDGATYDVAHPEAALVRGMTLHVHMRLSGFAGPAGERIAYISLIHITRIEFYYPGDAPPS
jgi:hypothetical protein